MVAYTNPDGIFLPLYCACIAIIAKDIVSQGIAALLCVFFLYKQFWPKVEPYFVNPNDRGCVCDGKIEKADKCRSKNCKSKLLMKITKKIDSAVFSIEIAMYILSNECLIKSLLDARHRGVKLRIILDRSLAKRFKNETEVWAENGN